MLGPSDDLRRDKNVMVCYMFGQYVQLGSWSGYLSAHYVMLVSMDGLLRGQYVILEDPVLGY